MNWPKVFGFLTSILSRHATRVNMPASMQSPDHDTISVHTEDGVLTGRPDAVREAMASLERRRELRKRWPQTAGGDIDTRRAMAALAQSFPTLRGADGVEPWDVDRFLSWLCGPAPSHGALHAGRFVLGVWNRTTDWCEATRGLGLEGGELLSRLDLVDAVGTWDDEHRAACWRWMEGPFWP